ncbi:MAG: tRNA (adenosine(37)-N6)-dimethylallyltransferase MiaA [Betaproteobacteria bacterium]|jgi:tRNA dimethylallyltransferase|nr:tRNA (adenosine(37)-N6)-dimethylallyltransferase MiaA [Rubrivivax sp.]
MTRAAALQGVVLAGPTASGKSALALELAARLPLEIVSVDSALVYRGMDIGTAKPTPAERAAVPHHLIDILDPTEAYSAARFAADATALAADIRARGRLPLLVGGTMLYVKALREGLHALPAADAAVRAALDAEAAERGWPALHAELARVDPATAARLPPLDAQRIQRALEVWRVSGRPLSAWHAQARPAGAAADDADAAWPVVSLEPRQRAWLHERIARRLAQMFEAGFVDEVRALRARGDLHPGLPSMRCVGYRQVWQGLDEGAFDAPGAPAAGSVRDAAVAATRQLAKRQLTWLRSISSRQVFACDDGAGLAGACDALRVHAGRLRP